MIRIRFHSPEKFKEFVKAVERINFAQKASIRELGNRTASSMRQTIRDKKVRPQAGEPTELENNITVEHFETPDEIGWGVGDIDRLNTNAKYWRAVNYGSNHLVGKFLPPGIFSPGNAKPNRKYSGEGRWKKGETDSDGRTWTAEITKPIPAMNYIETTVTFVRGQINAIANIFRRR